MNHVKLAFAILAAIIAVSIFSEYAVNRKCNEITDILYELKAAAENGDIERSAELCTDVNDTWNRAERLFSYTIPIDKLCQTQQSIYRLQPLLGADADEFEAEIMTAVVLCSKLC
ncbi:MAG: DUF4363 family protein [Ruminococcus sp.]|nr:DUF4363 family protein [Ruminococcus sp.]